MATLEPEVKNLNHLRSGRRSPAPWNELVDDDDRARPAADPVVARLRTWGAAELRSRQNLADLEIATQGISFRVASEDGGLDRSWPFDVIPRIIEAQEWARVERGIVQRLRALNSFLDDIYHAGRVIDDGVIPRTVVEESAGFRTECHGASPRHGVWAHIGGVDLIRGANGTMHVLEDNVRVPSGVSYLLENRALSKAALADLFERQSVQPVDAYPEYLAALLRWIAPDGVDEPTVVVLTPGVHNSAFFEHAFLARSLGADLVEGRDLFIDADGDVCARTLSGPRRVDVIYRRVDDLFLDPEVFRAESLLGCRGLFEAWRRGRVALANAPGTGVADDKLVYCWVPDMIRFYLGEEPILPNVPTWRCVDAVERRFVCENLRELVLKPTGESGGYGILIGDRATDAQLRDAVVAIETNPRGWVAQPIVSLSVVPTLCDDGIEPRHVDLRPFALSGPIPYVTPGGLTRVALRRGSLIVNSSQGGGSKDTWVVDRTHPLTAGS